MRDGRLKHLLDATAGALTVGLFGAIKHIDRKRMANFAGALMRKIGPRLREHRTGREQLRLAFPEKSDADIERILGGVWDNLGRIAVEFAHLDEFSVEGFGTPTADVITYPAESKERHDRLMATGHAAIGFAAHLANWELPGIGAKLIGVKSAVLYRRPNIGAVNDVIVKLRQPLMGELVPTGLDAPVKLARLLQSGVHVGMLADQHYSKGVEVVFFGRPCLANPLIAMLARQTELPIYGMRVVRKPDGNSFWGEISEPVEPIRDANGRIDIKGTMQAITSVIEGWIRQYPEQWLWLHRRWR
ncbi:MAG TPA: lipid A biosynthesis lauroyl acyltransferase [Xanthobacteraceae bacterium]|jgi:Kdo2-lipid IVA lauroyltransferase/acyltransferase|nr:lipid A biosynthesis lauroyl acyltransferase [Xanthobacteraceae bacterium]